MIVYSTYIDFLGIIDRFADGNAGRSSTFRPLRRPYEGECQFQRHMDAQRDRHEERLRAACRVLRGQRASAETGERGPERDGEFRILMLAL